MQLPIGKHFMTIREKSFNNTFGMVRTNRDGSSRGHQGWDIAAFPGSPVYAITNGVIEFINKARKIPNKKGGFDVAPYGNEVCLGFNHNGKTLYAQYAHLQSFAVVERQFVGEGEVLGYVGQTGNAEGQHHSASHLHFEIRTSNNRYLGAGFGGRLDPGTVLGWDPILDLIFQDFPKLG